MIYSAFADLQLHNWRSFGTDENTGMSKRLIDQVKILEQIRTINKKYSVSFCLFGGDWFQAVDEIPTSVLNVTKEHFKQETVPYLMVDGNHDLVKRVDPKWYDKSMNVITEFGKVVSVKDVLDLYNYNIKIINYQDEVDYNGSYDLIALHKQPSIVNKHGHRFDGANWNALSKKNKMVFFFHYHDRMQLSDNCFILGAPLQLTFGDDGDRGMYLIDTAGQSSVLCTEFPDVKIVNGVALAFIKLDYPEFITIDDASKITDSRHYYKFPKNTKDDVKVSGVPVMMAEEYEERLKSSDFNDILLEYLTREGKPAGYLNEINDILVSKLVLHKNFYKGKIAKVSIKDYMSISDVTYSPQVGFNLVYGINQDLDSNGAGKSSIVDSIYWCLFGENTKGLVNTDIVRDGCKDCMVSVLLVDGKQETLITRSKKDGLDITITNDGVVGSSVVDGLRQSDKQKYLEEQILGFDKFTYLAACYFSQESLVTLTGLSDVGKTNMVTHLLGFEKYDDLYEDIHMKIVEIDSDIAQINENIKSLNNNIDKSNSLMRACKLEIENQERYLSEDNFAQEEMKRKIEKLEQDLDLVRKEIDVDQVNYDVMIDHLNSDINSLKLELVDHRKNKDNANRNFNYYEKKLSEANIAVRITEDSITRINKEINLLNNANDMAGQRCDKCGSLISADSIQEYVNIKMGEINILNDKLNSEKLILNELTTKFEEHVVSADNIDLLITKTHESVDSLNEEVNKLLADKNRSLSAVNDRKSKETSILNAINNAKSMIDKHQQNKDRIESRIIEYTKNMAAYDTEINGYNEKLTSVRNDILVLENKKLILEFWKVAFSPKGIRPLLLDRFCNQFNKIVNEYLAAASSGTMGVMLSPTSTIESGGERNKIGVNVYIRNRIKKYASLSGGEKRRVDVSLCLALNKWVSSNCGLSFGLLGTMVLDELFAGIDKVGEEAIGTLLYNEGRNKAVYVISHNLELGSYANGFICVEKRDGVSKLLNSVSGLQGGEVLNEERA